MSCLEIPYLLLSLQVFFQLPLAARLYSQSASSAVQWYHQLSWAVLVGCCFHHSVAVFLLVACISQWNIYNEYINWLKEKNMLSSFEMKWQFWKERTTMFFLVLHFEEYYFLVKQFKILVWFTGQGQSLKAVA